MGTASSSLTESYFANAVFLGRRDWSYGSSEATLLAGDNVSLRAMSTNSATIANNWLNPSGGGFWGVWQNRAGGHSAGQRLPGHGRPRWTATRPTTWPSRWMQRKEEAFKTGHVVGASVL